MGMMGMDALRFCNSLNKPFRPFRFHLRSLVDSELVTVGRCLINKISLDFPNQRLLDKTNSTRTKCLFTNFY